MAPAGAATVLPFGKSWHTGAVACNDAAGDIEHTEPVWRMTNTGSAERVHGGPMTVVAGIVALLLLSYLVVALLQPERF